MRKKTLLVTGSGGLVGSEVVDFLHNDFDQVFGIDNNQRKFLFGKDGDVNLRINEIINKVSNYKHCNIDIRDRKKIFTLFEKIKPTVVVHCAGQPSHDLAAKIPFQDYDINSVGTFNLIETTRLFSKNPTFIFLSTNKVYGDAPNFIKLKELTKRYEFIDKNFKKGIAENLSIDQNTHSLFGSSKLGADITVQEYGRYFGMQTCVVRAGCVTGPNHSGVQLHGFLNFLVKTNVERKIYNIFGYKGKQVRDNIHAKDLANFIRHFISKPRIAEVYNVGGGKKNSISILEAFDLVHKYSGIEMKSKYKKKNRIGDHLCYYSDLTKTKKHYPGWDININLDDIICEILEKIYYVKK